MARISLDENTIPFTIKQRYIIRLALHLSMTNIMFFYVLAHFDISSRIALLVCRLGTEFMITF